jgi:hypothetical protein
MSIPSINSVAARILNGTTTLMQNQARARSRSEVAAYLEGMPEYLRKDIGLVDGADIIEAVEHGILRNRGNYDPRRELTMVPHAA